MNSGRANPQALRELAGVTVVPLLMIFDGSFQLGKVTSYWRKTNTNHVFQKCSKEVT